MFGWKKKPAVSRLQALLADYPPFAPVHRGHSIRTAGSAGPILSAAQCRENFLAYRDAVPERIELLAPVLRALGVDPDAAYGDTETFVRQLHPTLLRELPPLYRPELAAHDAWDRSDRAGDAIVLSFMADLAMLDANVLMRAKPGAFLGMNLDPGDRRMYSYRRPCVIGLADRLHPDSPPDVFWLEGEWFGYYANMDRPARLAPPGYTPGMMDVIGGQLLIRLERYHVDLRLEERRRDTWYAQAD